METITNIINDKYLPLIQLEDIFLEAEAFTDTGKGYILSIIIAGSIIQGEIIFETLNVGDGKVRSPSVFLQRCGVVIKELIKFMINGNEDKRLVVDRHFEIFFWRNLRKVGLGVSGMNFLESEVIEFK